MVRIHPGPQVFITPMKDLRKDKKLSGKKLRELGESLREKENYKKALQVLTVAIITCQKEGDYETLVDVLKDRTLTLKHLFLKSKDKTYAILAKKDAESMLAVSEEFNLKNKLHTSYFRLGEIDMLFEDFKSAAENYQNALKFYQGSLSEKGDYRYHLGEAIFKAGDERKGEEFMLEGLKEIKTGRDRVNPFYANVWESGVHLRLAELLAKIKPTEAKKHLKEAEKIAGSDERLIIRRRQIKKIKEKLSL